MLDHPNLNCDNCFKHYAEQKYQIKPLCFTGTCPIGDVAPDRRVNEAINKWLTARSLRNATDDPVLARPILEASGLTDDPLLLVEMERIFATWQDKETKKRQERDSRKRQTRRQR